MSKLTKYVPVFIILIGFGFILLALVSDLLGIGSKAGFGPKQIFLIILGIVAIISGIILASPLGRGLWNWSFSPPGKETEPTSILLYVIWFGILTGLGEVAIIAYRRYFNSELILKSPHFFWMIPFGVVIVFFLPGIVFYLYARLNKRKSPLMIVFFTFVFLASASWFFLFQEIHIYASLLISAGIAVQVSRLLIKYKIGFLRFVRLSLPIFITIIAILFFVLHLLDSVHERTALAKLPQPTVNSPNVLLVVLDTVRAQNLSLYGYSRSTTPSLEQLSENGTVFLQAYSPSSWTLPSIASMFTGRWLHELSVGSTSPLDDEYPTLAEVFNANGYLTGGFVANTLVGGNEFGLNRGFSHYEVYRKSLDQIILYTSLVNTIQKELRSIIGEHRYFWPKTAEEVNSELLHWLDLQSNRPFFAFLNYMDAHGPYQPPDPYAEKYGSKAMRVNPFNKPKEEWSQDEIQAELDAYDGAISYLDDQVGLLMKQLDERGLLENTLVIIVSDHGEQFGDHDLFGHGNSLYMQTLHVPLMFIFPNHVPPGEKIQTQISLRDLPSTILDIIEINDPNQLPGTSFAMLMGNHTFGISALSQNNSSEEILSELNWSPDADFNQWDPISRGDMKSLVNQNYHYILNGDDAEELYDFITDPNELENLAFSEDQYDKLERFRESINTITRNK